MTRTGELWAFRDLDRETAEMEDAAFTHDYVICENFLQRAKKPAAKAGKPAAPEPYQNLPPWARAARLLEDRLSAARARAGRHHRRVREWLAQQEMDRAQARIEEEEVDEAELVVSKTDMLADEERAGLGGVAERLEEASGDRWFAERRWREAEARAAKAREARGMVGRGGSGEEEREEDEMGVGAGERDGEEEADLMTVAFGRVAIEPWEKEVPLTTAQLKASLQGLWDLVRV